MKFYMTKNAITFILILLTVTSISYANIILPALVSNNMVLQERVEVKLWGWAEPGEKIFITASWNNKTDSVRYSFSKGGIGYLFGINSLPVSPFTTDTLYK